MSSSGGDVGTKGRCPGRKTTPVGCGPASDTVNGTEASSVVRRCCCRRGASLRRVGTQRGALRAVPSTSPSPRWCRWAGSLQSRNAVNLGSEIGLQDARGCRKPQSAEVARNHESGVSRVQDGSCVRRCSVHEALRVEGDFEHGRRHEFGREATRRGSPAWPEGVERDPHEGANLKTDVAKERCVTRKGACRSLRRRAKVATKTGANRGASEHSNSLSTMARPDE